MEGHKLPRVSKIWTTRMYVPRKLAATLSQSACDASRCLYACSRNPITLTITEKGNFWSPISDIINIPHPLLRPRTDQLEKTSLVTNQNGQIYISLFNFWPTQFAPLLLPPQRFGPLIKAQHVSDSNTALREFGSQFGVLQPIRSSSWTAKI